MTEKTNLPRRVVAARRTLTVGAIAATALSTSALAEPLSMDADQGAWIKLAQAEGEASAGGEGEGEGNGGMAAGGEGEGEGEAGGASDPCAAASAGGEGEGEGSASAASAQGEGEAAASGEGEAAASGEGEGEGTAAAAGEGASGEGEGEGEGGEASAGAEACLSRDLSFMEGHLRAGITLYEAGDLEAAKTHMGHPIEEKYDAVAAPLEERGYGRLREELSALAEAAESEASLDEIRGHYDTVVTTINDVRDDLPAAVRLMSFAMLTRIAADEYAVAVEGGEVSNLHEYQDSWGFLRVVETEAGELAESDDQAVADAAASVVEQVETTAAAYGDIQGSGDFKMDPSILYGAASRMELAAMGLR